MATSTVSLQDVIRAHASTQARSSQVVGDSEKLSQENELLRGQQEDAARLMQELAVQQTGRESDLALEREKRKAAVTDIFNVDLTNPDNQLAYLAREQAAAVRESNERAKEAQNLTDMGISDSPLDYMISRPFAFREAQASTAAAKRAEVLDKAIGELNTQVPAAVKVQDSIMQTFTEADAKRNAEITALKAADQVRELQLKNNTAYLNDLKAIQGIAAQDFDMTVTKYRLIEETKLRSLQMEEMIEKRKERKADKLALEESMSWYNAGAKALNRPTFTDPLQFAASYKRDPKQFNDIINHGGMFVGNPDAQTFVARSPGAAQVHLETVRGSLPPSAARVSDFLQMETNFAKQDLVKAGGKLTAEAVAQAANIKMLGGEVTSEDGKTKKKATGTVRDLLNNVEQDLAGGKVKNIYGAPALAVVQTVVPQLKEMKGFEDVIVPAALATQGTPTADAVMKQAALSIREGKLGVEEAATITQNYFKAVVLANNANEQYQRVGLPPQVGYKALVADPVLKNEFESIDVMNDTARVKHMLVRATTAAKFGRRDTGMFR